MFSVTVIGGGFTGLSTALHLAERGIDVAVLEANEPGWGASGRNGGQVNPGLKPDPAAVEAAFGPDLGRRMVDFCLVRARLAVRDHPPLPDRMRRPHRRHAARRLSSGPCRRCAAHGGGLHSARHAGHAAGCRPGAGGHGDRPLRDGHAGPARRQCAAARPGAGTRAGGDAGRGRGAWRDAGAVPTAAGRRMARHHPPPAPSRRRRSCWGGNGYTDGLWPRPCARASVPVFSSIAATEPLADDVARQVMPSGSVLYESGHITVYLRLDPANRPADGRPRPASARSTTRRPWTT